MHKCVASTRIIGENWQPGLNGSVCRVGDDGILSHYSLGGD